MSTTKSAYYWAAAAEVLPRASNDLLGSATGAYVPVVGLAETERAFRAEVDRSMDALGFDVVTIEDVQRLRSSVDTSGLSEVMKERVGALNENNRLEFGSFHSFSGKGER